MKTALFVVGESIKYNSILMSYIDRESLKFLNTIDMKIFLENNDKNLFLTLEEIISKVEYTLVVCDEKNFNTIGKILSTIYQDSLSVKLDMLIPSKSSLYDKDSYLLEQDGKKINVLKVKEGGMLPQILFNVERDVKFINIFDMDEESCKILLEPIAENYETKIKIVKIVEGWNLVKIESLRYGQINNFIESAKMLLEKKIIDRRDVVSHIVSKLIQNGIKITTAESCTGGALSAKLIEYSGVSNIINGNLVTYSNKIKESWLGVSPDTLKKHGAVSQECVKQMLEGALEISDSDIAIAISGIAGPTGGSVQKPVGTVYIGIKDRKNRQIVERFHLKGDRKHIQNQAVLYALKLLMEYEKDIFF